MAKTIVFAPKTFRTRTIPIAAGRSIARRPSFETASAILNGAAVKSLSRRRFADFWDEKGDEQIAPALRPAPALPVPSQPMPAVLPRRSPAAAASHWGTPQAGASQAESFQAVQPEKD